MAQNEKKVLRQKVVIDLEIVVTKEELPVIISPSEECEELEGEEEGERPAGEIQLTEEVKEEMESFVEQVNPVVLSDGIQNLMIFYQKKEPDRENWYLAFLNQIGALMDLLTVLRHR